MVGSHSWISYAYECCVTTCYWHVYPNWLLITAHLFEWHRQNLKLFHLLSAMNASGCVTFLCPLSLVGAFYVVLPTVFFLITHCPLPSPFFHWQASAFWRLTDCDALAGIVEQRSPGESSPLFLCLSECSFKEWLLLESSTSTNINLSRGTCNLFGTSLHECGHKDISISPMHLEKKHKCTILSVCTMEVQFA